MLSRYLLIQAFVITAFFPLSGLAVPSGTSSFGVWKKSTDLDYEEEDEDEKEDEENKSQFSQRLVPIRPKSGQYNKGFFPQGSVQGIFSEGYVNPTEKNQLTMLRPMPGQEKKKKDPEKKEQPTPAPEEKEKTIFEMEKEEFRAELERRYGTPDQIPLVQPNEDAPPCYKAASLASQKGDLALARKYTECFVRHQKRLEQTANEVMKLTMKAASPEGTNYSSSSGPDYENIGVVQDPELDKDSQRQKDGPQDGFKVGAIDSSTRQLISVAERAEPRLKPKYGTVNEDPFADEDDPMAELFVSEEKLRARARRERAAIVPKDPQGEVRVYFFFDKDDLNAFAMFPVLERVFQAHKDDLSFHIVGFTLGSATVTTTSGLKARARVNFPIRSGSRLARQLGIKNSSSVVIVSPATGRFVVEEGIRGFGYIDELVKMVQGKPARTEKKK